MFLEESTCSLAWLAHQEFALTQQNQLLLAGAWREVQEARATTAREKLRVADETRRLEERGRDHARDLEARLSSAEEKLERLGGELGAARAEVLEMKEGCNAALVAVAQAGKERDAAVAAITPARGELDDVYLGDHPGSGR